jgi:plasmid stabilization system protein ParE
VVSSRARADIDAVLDDLEIRAGVRVAADYVASLKALYLRLGSFPEAGAVRPALGRYARISLLLPYVAIYRYSARPCPHLSQASAHTKCSPARKLRAVFS